MRSGHTFSTQQRAALFGEIDLLGFYDHLSTVTAILMHIS